MPLKRVSGRPNVVLVGRPNVGKSTLFNRITNSRRAIVTPVAGTTRDVNALPADWQGTPFNLVDTGGMFGASEDPLHKLVVTHGRRAVETADLLVFVVDGREGLVSGDEEIAAALRTSKAPVADGRQQDRRQTRAWTRVRILPTRLRAGGRDRRRARRRRRRPAGRDRRAATRTVRERRACRDAAGNRHRHRRPSERRQVVAAQSVAAGRAIDRQRACRGRRATPWTLC